MPAWVALHSRFKKLFGGKPGPAQPQTAASTNAANKTISAIQGLTEHEESLEKRKALLEKRVEAELEKAKEFTKQKKKPQVMLHDCVCLQAECYGPGSLQGSFVRF